MINTVVIQSVSDIRLARYPKYLTILRIISDNIIYDLIQVSEKIQTILLAFGLFTLYFVSKIFILTSHIDLKISKEILTLPKSRYLIVANHKRMSDPFIINTLLPFNTYKKLFPIRSFTTTRMFDKPLLKPFLYPAGCFRANSTEGKLSGLKGGLKLSDKNQTLLIFPEGKRVKKGMKNVKLKIGPAYLATYRDFTILPVYIDYRNGDIRNSVYVNWGKPFKINKEKYFSDLDKLNTYIFSHVLALRNKMNG